MNLIKLHNHQILLSRELRLNVINSNHKFYFDRFKSVDQITYMGFKEFIFKFLKSLKFKILIQGNLSKLQALEMTQKIVDNFNVESQSSRRKKDPKVNQIPVGSTFLRIKSLLPNDKNSVIKNYYQIGVVTTESECLLELLVKVMREPLFNYIRTKEQLGYAVSCSTKKDDHVLGLAIAVESQEKRNSSWVVDSKVDKFLTVFLSFLENLKEVDFEMIKRSIIAHKRLVDADLEQEVNRNWLEIRESKYQFERGDIEARQLELLRKADLIIFFKDHFLSQNVRKLSLHVVANADDGNDSLLQHGYLHLDLMTEDKQNTIRNIAQFKNSLAACERYHNK